MTPKGSTTTGGRRFGARLPYTVDVDYATAELRALTRAVTGNDLVGWGDLVDHIQRQRRRAVWMPPHADPTLARAQAALDAADEAGYFDGVPWRDRAGLRARARQLLGPGWRTECVLVGEGVRPRLRITRGPKF